MTNEQLCALALSAIDDADARVVLADAVEEADWWSHTVAWVFKYHDWRGYPNPKDGMGADNTRWLLYSWALRAKRSKPTIELARAIAAVLLFGDWPTSWPLAERCRLSLADVWLREMNDAERRMRAQWERSYYATSTSDDETDSDEGNGFHEVGPRW